MKLSSCATIHEVKSLPLEGRGSKCLIFKNACYFCELPVARVSLSSKVICVLENKQEKKIDLDLGSIILSRIPNSI